ncbi:nuclear transport factor 2 family protein [Rhodococcus sp. 14C212]|uniref:nuclear transport factor 2 family protein n=1 Tax=Rhodococcus sp. 14C212 TaxID=2711209 RepID=UPI0013EB07F7|nr:nuclear transport factor 2 family protein [Rhodococcus sp. 14C212]NGP07379.1 nuclear transport factor 2 family protein [Rhodococcus sp. 14C212]
MLTLWKLIRSKVLGLEQRILLLEDQGAIVRTLTRYAQCLDYGDEDGFINCFTADAEYEIRSAQTPQRSGGQRTESGMCYSGREALRAFIQQHTRAPMVFHKHVAMNPLVELEGDHASSVSYILRLDVDLSGTIYVRAFGRYLDRLRRCEDGEWRIECRIAEPEALDLREFRRAALSPEEPLRF